MTEPNSAEPNQPDDEPDPRATQRDLVPEIAGYRCLGIIGSGGSGTVWKAIEEATGREVALKILSGGAFTPEAAKERFKREVKLAARLEHPHIARVYDSGLHEGICYYAMQYIEGEPLDVFVRQRGLKETVRLIARVGRVLDYAHRLRIVHRGLKPGNILVSDDGEPHVLDFGLAKSLEPDEDDQGISVTGDVAGTLAYMAPEQAGGKIRRIDERTDVYALGVLLYQAVTGVLPHRVDGSQFEILRRIVQDPIK
ncbi:MAG: serine/threonine-protein kinase, partial [Verrucomicrobiota bacterium]